MQKVGIIGSRTLPLEAESGVLEWIKTHLDLAAITTIVSGGSSGADTLAEKLAERLGKEMVVFRPDYERYKRKAGVIRNAEIANTADFCLALVDKPLEASRGTDDCVKKFRKLKKPVRVLRFQAGQWHLEPVQEPIFRRHADK